MSIAIGGNSVSKMYVGSTEITKAYIGDTLVYGGTQPTIPNYLCFKALEASTIGMTSTLPTFPNLEYSADTDTWTTWDGSSVSLSAGDEIYMRGINTTLATGTNVISTFTMTGKIEAHGNIMSLLYGANFDGELTIPSDYCFRKLFYQCTSLVTAPLLPATTMKVRCYSDLFNGCTGLTNAPSLPATNLAEYCYMAIFYNCSALTTAPTLPAETLAAQCYYQMFYGCSELVTPPALPATTLTKGCYQGLFFGCSKLATAPQLPATTLQQNCYHQMFSGCTSLTTAPVLPATSLLNRCYYMMFNGCTSLNYIKAMFTTTPTNTSTSPTYRWVRNVSSTGTFVKNASAGWNVTGDYGIPSGWTVQTASS